MADQTAIKAVTVPSAGLAAWKGTARYEVLSCLGRGGMGIVYETFDRQHNERIALKTLLHADAAGLYQFKREFRTLADVLHPNLVHLHELVAGEGDEVLFTMELVIGTDFLEYVHKPGAPRGGTQTDVATSRMAGRRLRRLSDPGALSDPGSSARSCSP